MSALYKAFFASLLVYLVPIFTPHVLMPLGAAVVMEIAEASDARDPLWIALDVSLALGLQALAGLLWYWFFHSPNWKRLVAIGATVPVFIATATGFYLLVIPALFLIEDDTAPEQTRWAEQCTVENYSLPSLNVSPHLSLSRAGQAWITEAGPLPMLSLVRLPGCEVAATEVRWSNVSPRVWHAAPGGRMVYSTHRRSDKKQLWWYLPGPDEDAVEFEKPENLHYNYPILSDDGEWVAWLRRSGGTPGQWELEVLLQRPVAGSASGEERTVPLKPLGTGSLRLLGVDAEKEVLTFEYDVRQFIGVDFQSKVLWGPLEPAAAKASAGHFLRLPGGWVAWDSYRDSGNYVVEWDLPAGKGVHRVLKGRRIHSLAVDPGGKYIAISVGTALSMGDIQDSVYVLRTRDGSEVFRKYFHPYTRSSVVFAGSEFFGYFEPEPHPGVVRFVRLPEGD